MRKRKYNLIIILMSLLAVSAYAGIIYEGNEYTETDMPFSKDGSGISYFVVSGTVSSVNSWNMRSLSINGTSYTNTWSSSMPAPIDGKKYFIVYEPKNKFAHFEISGTNDWSTGIDTTIVPDTSAIDLPFSKDGADRIYFTTSGTITSISSWSMDTLTINGVDYKNIWSSTMPPRIDGTYYIYYSASLAGAHVEIAGNNDTVVVTPDTMAIDLPFEYSGIGEKYFVTSANIGTVNSWSMEILSINGVDYSNSWSGTMPEKIDGQYIIYYKTNLPGGHVELEEADPYPAIVNYNGQDYTKVMMPYSLSGGSTQYVYVYGTVTSFSSTNMNSLMINGVDMTNQSSSTASMPPSIDGKYFITYVPKNWKSNFTIDGSVEEPVYILNIKVFLQSALSSNGQ
ncbi:MAG: hypothetical protein K9N07_11440 [Candidatus Cloacimonetes bacterium]|nr:hypothetical protein [Candidatus Cloacimonadota bacterium]